MTKCPVSGCDRASYPKAAKGLCNAHYHRLRRGKPLDDGAPIQRRGEGWTSSHGYKYLGKRAAHRRAMEAKIGRRLSYNEVVHRKDENPKNNDPINLEIVSRGDHSRIHNTGKTNEERRRERLAGKP